MGQQGRRVGDGMREILPLVKDVGMPVRGKEGRLRSRMVFLLERQNPGELAPSDNVCDDI